MDSRQNRRIDQTEEDVINKTWKNRSARHINFPPRWKKLEDVRKASIFVKKGGPNDLDRNYVTKQDILDGNRPHWWNLSWPPPPEGVVCYYIPDNKDIQVGFIVRGNDPFGGHHMMLVLGFNEEGTRIKVEVLTSFGDEGLKGREWKGRGHIYFWSPDSDWGRDGTLCPYPPFRLYGESAKGVRDTAVMAWRPKYEVSFEDVHCLVSVGMSPISMVTLSAMHDIANQISIPEQFDAACRALGHGEYFDRGGRKKEQVDTTKYNDLMRLMDPVFRELEEFDMTPGEGESFRNHRNNLEVDGFYLSEEDAAASNEVGYDPVNVQFIMQEQQVANQQEHGAVVNSNLPISPDAAKLVEILSKPGGVEILRKACEKIEQEFEQHQAGSESKRTGVTQELQRAGVNDDEDDFEEVVTEGVTTGSLAEEDATRGGLFAELDGNSHQDKQTEDAATAGASRDSASLLPALAAAQTHTSSRSARARVRAPTPDIFSPLEPVSPETHHSRNRGRTRSRSPLRDITNQVYDGREFERERSPDDLEPERLGYDEEDHTGRKEHKGKKNKRKSKEELEREEKAFMAEQEAIGMAMLESDGDSLDF